RHAEGPGRRAGRAREARQDARIAAAAVDPVGAGGGDPFRRRRRRLRRRREVEVRKPPDPPRRPRGARAVRAALRRRREVPRGGHALRRAPGPDRGRGAEGLEEERRLFYVAATRAKDELLLVHPLAAFDRYGIVVVTEPSRFLNE